MTQHSHDHTFTDSEIMCIEIALKFYVKHCEEQIGKGIIPPYFSHKKTCEYVLKELPNGLIPESCRP